MIEIDYNKKVIELRKNSSNSYDVLLVKPLTLVAGEDTVFESSFELSIGEQFESILFNGMIADDSDDYNNIFVPSVLLNKYSADLDDFDIYLYNSDDHDITLPKGLKIGELVELLTYTDDYSRLLKENQNTKIIYNSNGLKVISTDESTHDINETEMVVEPDGTKYLKIIYPDKEPVQTINE